MSDKLRPMRIKEFQQYIAKMCYVYGVRRINNKFGYFNDEFLYKIVICARVVLVLIDCDWWCFMLGVQTPPLGADAWAIFALVSFKFSKAFR